MGRNHQTGRVPWSLAIRDVLADGEWHDREELIAVGKRAVPPGIAYRRFERQRKTAARYRNEPGATRRGDEFAVVASGAKRVAYDCVRAMVASGVVERDGNRYRLIPFDRDGGEAPTSDQTGGLSPPPE